MTHLGLMRKKTKNLFKTTFDRYVTSPQIHSLYQASIISLTNIANICSIMFLFSFLFHDIIFDLGIQQKNSWKINLFEVKNCDF